MADLSAATQSPSVSSTSSGAEPSAPGGAASPGGCPALGTKSCGSSCADSFVSSSSSQPVSLFSTSQEGLGSLCSEEPPSGIRTSSLFASSETHNTDPTVLPGEPRGAVGGRPVLAKEGEGKERAALLDVETTGRPQGTGQDGANSPVSVAEGGHCSRPPVPASFPERPASLSQQAVQMAAQTNTDQGAKNPNETPSRGDRAAPAAGDTFVPLTAQKPPPEQPEAGGRPAASSSPCTVSGGGGIDKDSPESPFEVIIDRAAFDKEFKDAYKEGANGFGRWAGHTARESPADIAEASDKVFPLRTREAGGYPAPATLTRQLSHTTAALEEVSRCVSDMHNFTNEVLTWDLAPPVRQQREKSDHVAKTTGLGVSECNPKIPVINLKANAHQKTSINGSTPISKSQENAVLRESAPDCHSSVTEVKSSVPGSVQKRDDTLAGFPASPVEKCASLGPGEAAVDVLEGEMDWRSPPLGEATEADSSGESEDTVIEDVAADASFESSKVQTEQPLSTSSADVKADEREVQKVLSCNRETETSESLAGSVSDSEPDVQPDFLKSSPASAGTCSHGHDGVVTSGDARQADRRSEVPPAEKVAISEDPKLPLAAYAKGFNKTGRAPSVTASACLESLQGHITYIDDSSPEDLLAAATAPGEAGGEEDGGAVPEATEETGGFRTAFPAGGRPGRAAGASEREDLRGGGSEPRAETRTRGGALPAALPAPRPGASLDLEQERLTIQALRELSERPGAARGEPEAPDEAREPPLASLTSAPERSQPRTAHRVRGRTDAKAGPDPGVSEEPPVVKDAAGIEFISSPSATDLASEHLLATLLAGLSVHDLIFWRDVRKTGFVFGTTLIVLLSLAAFSVISVVSYLILALLSVTISFRVYRSVIQAVQKSEEGHPFKSYLDVDITLSSEAFHNYVNAAMVHVNKALKLVIRLFLVEDLVDSLKLAVFMWLMTYVGAVFNGITLLILADLLVFSVPIVYEKYKTQIDHYVGIVRDQTKSIVEKIQAKLPGIAKKKAE